MPSNDEQSAIFGEAMKQRFEEFVEWSVANSSTHSRTLASKDFDDCRRQISLLADCRSNIGTQNKAIPEPSDSGPQYVNVTPSPWP